MKSFITAFLFLASSFFFAGCAKAKTTIVTIGTGSVTGVYYPTGGAISRMVNAKFDTYKIKSAVESTVGSVHNVNAVLKRELDFALAQSDTHYKAINGLVEWEDAGPQEDLRSVFSLHPESVTLVASEHSGITSVAELRGKRINLGVKGTGQLQNVRDLLAASGIAESEMEAQYMKPANAPGLLQRAEIDAFFFTVGHPNTNIKEATTGSLSVRLIPIRGPGVDALLGELPYYASSIIPFHLYPQALNTEDIPSFGVKATFVTSKNTSEDIVYAVTREVFENLSDFRTLHPALQILTRENMMAGLSAPIHKGALKYYREAGMLSLINPALIQE